MDIKKVNEMYIVEKKEGALDTFTKDFLKELTDINIPYVLISGYIAILFGRNRSSEDIDILIPPITEEEFNTMWEQLNKKYECLNTTHKKEAYKEYLKEGVAIRFATKGTIIPNMELKTSKTSLEKWALKNRQQVQVNNNQIYISPIELQIAYKAYLGSEKDIEDAIFLQELFKEEMNQEQLHYFLKGLQVKKIYEEQIK